MSALQWELAGSAYAVACSAYAYQGDMHGVKDIGSETVPVKRKLIADNAKGTFRHN